MHAFTSQALPPLRKEERSGDTNTRAYNRGMQWGGSRLLACKRLGVGNHGSSIYVTLVAVDLSSKMIYVSHPLSGKAASSVCSQCACYFVQS